VLISAQDRRTSAQYSMIVQSSQTGQSPGKFVGVVEVEVPDGVDDQVLPQLGRFG